MSLGFARLSVTVGLLAAATACSKDRAGEQSSRTEGSAAPAAAAKPAGGQGDQYPTPRWPSYFKPPKNVEDLMAPARALVRNTSGFQGKGMGILQPGEHVLIVPTSSADPMVVD